MFYRMDIMSMSADVVVAFGRINQKRIALSAEPERCQRIIRQRSKNKVTIFLYNVYIIGEV